ncbi:MAG: preprotein translocase subunit SecG [Phycisphaerae bacterium]|nr:preprotein translocase subunit SecG [Phycisphaerae bacterium]
MAVVFGILFLIVCFLLILVVLLQKGRGGGLSGAFGGAGGAGSAFGTRTGDVFTWVTIGLTAAFLLLAIATTLAVRADIPTSQVAMPVFSPMSWDVKEKGDSTTVTMKVTTKGAKIYYTVTGKEPTKDSLPYSTTSVTVKRGQTLKAKAFRSGMDPSETVTVLYDVPKPEPKATPEPVAVPKPVDETKKTPEQPAPAAPKTAPKKTVGPPVPLAPKPAPAK